MENWRQSADNWRSRNDEPKGLYSVFLKRKKKKKIDDEQKCCEKMVIITVNCQKKEK